MLPQVRSVTTMDRNEGPKKPWDYKRTSLEQMGIVKRRALNAGMYNGMDNSYQLYGNHNLGTHRPVANSRQ